MPRDLNGSEQDPSESPESLVTLIVSLSERLERIENAVAALQADMTAVFDRILRLEEDRRVLSGLIRTLAQTQGYELQTEERGGGIVATWGRASGLVLP